MGRNYYGCSFRKLKKALTKKIQTEELTTVTCSHVHIEFSKEIAEWTQAGYYQNPKFDDFWTKFNSYQHKHRDRYKHHIWHTAYYSVKQMQDEEDKSPTKSNLVRFLICGCNCVELGPKMNIFLCHAPNKYPTTLEGVLYYLLVAMEDCAKYCGGKVMVSWSQQQRIPFFKDIIGTKTLGRRIKSITDK